MQVQLQPNMNKVYDEIAESWYGLRHWTRFRTELEELADRWKCGRLLNAGCAHGPDFLPFVGRFKLCGVDFSARMIGFARKYARKHVFEADLVVADARSLPFDDGVFDFAISVAAYHNIRGGEDRRQAFSQLCRVLKPGGEAFITVWNRWQLKFWFSGKEVMVPWRTRSGTLDRYYYLYSSGELVSDLRRSGFSVLSVLPEKSHFLPVPWFSRNICVLVRKPV